jgi:hypothetical protein
MNSDTQFVKDNIKFNILTPKLIQQYDSYWDTNLVPKNNESLKSFKHKNYFVELKRVINLDRRGRDLLPVKNSMCKHIWKYYDGNLRNFYLDLVGDTPYRKEIESNQTELTTRISRKNTNKINSGFIYIITNPKIQGWCKVGMTTNLKRRLSGYQTSDPFRQFQYYRIWYVEYRKATERELFEYFKTCGLTTQNEWVNKKHNTVSKAIKHFLRSNEYLVYATKDPHQL